MVDTIFKARFFLKRAFFAGACPRLVLAGRI